MMQLFLTSSVNEVASDIAKRIKTKNKTLAFIYTAAEVEEGGKDADWCQADRKALVDIGFDVTDYTISEKTKTQLEEELGILDVIFVSGGNTFYLLQQAQQSGFVKVVRELVIAKGKTYIGSSAGSIIAGPDTYPTHRIDKVSVAPHLNGYKGFDLVNFCVFPHWGSEYFKDLYLNKRLDFAYSKNQVPIVLLTDKQYVWVKNESLQIIEVS